MNIFSRSLKFCYQRVKSIKFQGVSDEFEKHSANMRRESQFHNTVMLNNARSNRYTGTETRPTPSTYNRRR
ncbi:MAG: hypothetical protein ACI9FJ_001029 [Alteromonadaceae bacterium]|jgi:hypothetical protein